MKESFRLQNHRFGCDFVGGRKRAQRSVNTTFPLLFSRRLVSLEANDFSLRKHSFTNLPAV